MNDTQKFISSTIGAVVCIALAVCAFVTPPIIALGTPLATALLVAGLASLGIQTVVGYQAARVSTTMKAADAGKR